MKNKANIFILMILLLFTCFFVCSCKNVSENPLDTISPSLADTETPSPSSTPEPKKSSVSYEASEGGVISGESFQELFSGEFTSKVIAVPDEYHYFFGWSDGITSPERIDVCEEESKNITAKFGERVRVLFRIEPPGCGEIVGSSTQYIIPNTNTEEVSTKSSSGYQFTGWSDGDTNNTKIVNSNEPVILVAFFEEVPNIPDLYINTCDGKTILNKEEYKGATLTLNSIVMNESIESLSCEVKGHGNSSWDNFKNSKPSYNLKLSEKVSLAGVGDVPGKQYVLLSNHSDALMLRNYTALTLGSRLDYIDYTVDFTFVNLFVNGKAMGLYQLCEKIKVGATRIDIEVDETGTEVDTGYLLELDQRAYKDSDSVYFYVGDTDVTISIKSDGKSPKQKSYITEYVTKFYNSCVKGDKNKVSEFADINSIVDMFILQEFTKNRDAGFASFFMVKEKGGVIKFTCPWDFDLSLGNDNMFRKTNDLVTLSKGGIYNDGNLFFVALYKCDWFKELVSKRLEEVTPIIRDVISDTINMAELLKDAYIVEDELWDIYNRRLLWEPDLITTFKNAEEHIEYYENWMNDRLDWMLNNLT